MLERRISRWYVSVLLALATALPVAAQLQTGDLYGKVADPQGQNLPGVTVTLEGVGSPAVQVTDEAGAFRFIGLYPGTYKMKAELQGFSTVEYPNVGIRVGGKTNVDVTLTPAAAEEITVTGEAPLLDERRVNRGADISARKLDEVPTARDPWSLLSLAPGVLVDRVNVGGNESGQQSNFNAPGASSRDNVFSVDGVVLTDMNAVGASATYFDFGAFEEVQLTTSSTDTSIATSGVTINQVTKRGTNEWRGQGRFLRTDGAWQSSASELSPGVTGNSIERVDEYGADVGGPLLKDHLWAWASYGVSDIRNIAGGGQLDRTKLEDHNYKLNFQLGSSDSGVLHYWTNDKLKFGRGASPQRAPETTLDQTTPSDIYKIEDSWIPSSTLYVDVLASRDDGAFTLSPKGGLDADIFVTPDNVRHGTWFDFAQTARIDQARGDVHYFFNTGAASHELKFGGGFRDQENHSGTVWPHGKIVWAGNLFGLDEGDAAVGFQRNRRVNFSTHYDSAWVQDTVTWDRLTLNAGLRWDGQSGKNLASSDPGDPTVPGAEEGAPGILPAIDFPGNSGGGFNWSTVVPRIGATYALGEQRKTLLRGTFSQYAEQLGQSIIGRVNPLGYSYAYFYFTDANNNLRLDPGETPSLSFAYAVGIDPSNPGSLVSANVTDRNLKPMITDEITLGADHSLRDDLGIGITFTLRNVRDITEQRVLVTDESGAVRVATRDDYVLSDPVSGILPNGQPSGEVAVYDLREGLTPTGGTLLTNGDREIQYRGVTVTFDKRLANRWSLSGNATWNDWKWKIGPQFRRFDDPTNVISDANGYSDDPGVYFEQSGGSNKDDVFVSGRWSYHLDGIYQVAPDHPWGFNVGGSIDGREGYIFPPSIRAGGSVGGRNVQLTNKVDAFRLGNVQVLNGHLDKDFAFGDVHAVVSLDGFNLTNDNVVLQRDRAADAEGQTYQPLEALSPRVFRVGVTLRFR